MSTTEKPPSAPPPSGGGPSLEAQVVRLGLMTPDEVATTMREEAETGRPFAELAVESGRLKAEDLAKVTGETPKQTLFAADPEPAAEPELERDPEPEPEPASLSIVPDPDPVPAEVDPEPEPEEEPLDEPAALVSELEPYGDDEPAEATGVTAAQVFVCLTSGERVAAGSFDNEAAAEERARELMTALDGNGDWPRLNGRFIRPDAVVSIDVELDS